MQSFSSASLLKLDPNSFPFSALPICFQVGKAKFFPRLKALRCISASTWGPPSLGGQWRHHRLPLVFLYPFLLSEGSLSPLQATQLISPSQLMSRPFVFRPPFAFQVWLRPRVKQSLSMLWRGFAFTHPLVLSPSPTREVLFACLPSFNVDLTIYSMLSI